MQQADRSGALHWHGLDPGLLRLRRALVLGVLGGLGLLVSALVLALAGPVEGAGALLVAVLVVGLALQAVGRRFRAWRWAEREDDLVLERGVVLRRTSVVPYGRMQYVDVTAGPLDRRVGIARVVLHTAAAATDASIPGLAAAEAERLRDRLAALGEARAAGV